MKKILKAVLAASLFAFLFASCQLVSGNSGSGTKSGGSSGSDSGSSSEITTTESTITYDCGDFVINNTGTSVDFVKNMGMGWNLGNTLDATTADSTSDVTSSTDTETYWGMPSTTEAMIKAVHDAGFKTIRIPVSWHNHISSVSDGTYTINSDWMARVKTIVDWAYNDGMCVIINIHHDNMPISTIENTKAYGYALSDDSDIQTTSINYITSVWKQIATTFASYSDALIFEVLNEPRDKDGEWKGNEWWTNSSEMIDVITKYENEAIKAIRSVAGNETRYIMVPGYAASGSDSSMLALYTFPTDSNTANGTNKLILSAHAYSPYNFAMSDFTDTTFDSSDASQLTTIFNYLKNNYVSKGIGVVMGEASASDKDNTSERVKWAKDYYSKATVAGIPVVLWDNMCTYASTGNSTSGENHGYLNRKTLKWYFPDIIKAMGSQVYDDYVEKVLIAGESSTDTDDSETSGDSDSDSTTSEDFDDSTKTLTSLFSGTYELAWTTNKTLEASLFSNADENSYLKFESTDVTSYTAGYLNLKLQAGDWSTVFYNGTCKGGKTGNEVLVPTSAEGTFYYKPTSSEWAEIKSKGMIVYGYGMTITDIILAY